MAFYADYLARTYQYCQEESGSGNARLTEAMVIAAIQRGYVRFARDTRCFRRAVPVSIAIVAEQPVYALPNDILELENVRYGEGFANQPAGNVVSAKSSSAADTTQTLTVYGYVNGTLTVQSNALALNGTAYVDSAASDFGPLVYVTADAACAGTVTVYRKSAGPTYAAITTLTPNMTLRRAESYTSPLTAKTVAQLDATNGLWRTVASGTPTCYYQARVNTAASAIGLYPTPSSSEAGKVVLLDATIVPSATTYAGGVPQVTTAGNEFLLADDFTDGPLRWAAWNLCATTLADDPEKRALAQTNLVQYQDLVTALRESLVDIMT